MPGDGSGKVDPSWISFYRLFSPPQFEPFLFALASRSSQDEPRRMNHADPPPETTEKAEENEPGGQTRLAQEQRCHQILCPDLQEHKCCRDLEGTVDDGLLDGGLPEIIEL